MKRRLLEGEDPETSDDWTIGHPLIFPNLLAVGKGTADVPIPRAGRRHAHACSSLPHAVRAPGRRAAPDVDPECELFDR